MYIKSIKAQGFKSFADKLELDFTPGINAIVGPNGSGKSNVVDALLWVLGEQSVKTLRGDSQMSDVIFSGSKSREEQKKASVSILFDNTDHSLNTPLSEVEIKRVIYKSGENEYYINGAKARLKDITDLLIDVTSKFNIISQGNINALVENKSSERRALFESAAGVLKYKKRKEESLRKLDATKENLTRVNLIIKELNTSLEPLEKQKDDALRYLDIKKNLESIEVGLLASDIYEYTNKYEEIKNENMLMQKELSSLNITHPMGLEKMKLEAIKIDESINEYNNKILNITSEIANLNSEKLLTVERTKFNASKEQINNNLLSLNEDKLKIEKDISVKNEEINALKTDLQNLAKELGESSDEALKIKISISKNEGSINELNKKVMILENKIRIENENQENNALLPRSVAAVLNNPRLKGISGTIGNLIECEPKYDTAIYTSLGASANFLVCDNMDSAKKAISYLKEGKLGRATFFPIDTIKSRLLDENILKSINNYTGFVDIASNLVKFDKKFKNIIENQLGNVLVCDTLDNMTDLAKKLEYKFKMVSLDGEIIYPGGSVSGGDKGSTSNKNNLINLKSELEKAKTDQKALEISLTSMQKQYKELNDINEDKAKKVSEKRVLISTMEDVLNKLNNDLEEVNNNIKGLDDMASGSLDEALKKLLESLNEKEKEKEISINKVKDLQSKKFDLSSEIESLEKKMNEQNTSYRSLENKISQNDIELGKYEVKIDNLLKDLSEEYNITYENALNNYPLDIDKDLARSKVTSYKNSLKNLTDVNIGSISEYERLKKRYDFLDKQKEDLEVSSSELIDIISQMDEVMKDKFKRTFDEIAKEFSKVFRVMFKGGNGLLKLTDENDLLNTGINILAVPPGKKLNSTASLSGGEKALTAICLIFAILNVKPVPFVVLDEAEAPLDEENVSMFGEYLGSLKGQSQFILITHKKKMMEYADCLFGITMQESGVSTRVSVKLEDY